MNQLEIYYDAQIGLSDRYENLGILQHYRNLYRQISLSPFRVNQSESRFVNFDRNIVKKNSPLTFGMAILKRKLPRIYWRIGLVTNFKNAVRADFVFSTFFYGVWLDRYLNFENRNLIVCNHDCINEYLDDQIEISSNHLSKYEYLFAAHTVYVPSEWVYQQTIKYYPEIKNKLVLIPHYIPFDSEVIRDNLRRRFEKAQLNRDKRLHFLHLGARSSYKNFTSVLQMLDESPILVELSVAGGGNLTPNEAKSIRRLRAKGHTINFFSVIDEAQKVQFLDSADLLLVPSMDEGFSYPTYEAAIRGLPTLKISTNTWGMQSNLIACSPSVAEIASSLSDFYQKPVDKVFNSIINELEMNNAKSNSGLSQLIGRLKSE